MSPARLRRPALSLPRSLRPKATLSITVMCGNRLYAWNTMPMSRLLAGTLVRSLPPTDTEPEVAWSRPARMRSAVVFPHPDGPSRATSSPGSMCRVSPSSARTDP